MTNDTSSRWIARGFGIALLALSFAAAQAAVGARVLLQTWNPTKPKEQGVQVVTNDATAVSDSVQMAWSSRVRPLICTQLLAVMGRRGIAAGQNLYDVKCLLDETVGFRLTPVRPNAVSAWLDVGGYIEATSTTPTVVGSYGDPRFSLALKATVHLTVSVQPDADHTLRVDAAKFALSKASIDSHNFSGDVLKFVAEDLLPFFNGPNFRQVAENAINGLGVNLTGPFNTALDPVNARLRGPSGAVRVAVWGNPDAIIVAFGPRELTPPSGGSMFGALRWDTSKLVSPGSCDSFSIAASVQTGPAPLLDPNGHFEPAQAPMRKVGSFQLQPGAAGGECRYRLTGLANGWPNEVLARSSIGAKKSTGNSLYHTSFLLAGDGWDGQTVVPQPSAERNYRVSGSVDAAAAVNPAVAARRDFLNPGGPVMNPAAPRQAATINPTTGVTAVQNKSKTSALLATPSGLNPVAQSPYAAVKNKADAVSLNPQPLPPKTAVTQSALTRATSRTDAVSLNPQPLPPGGAPTALPAQAPSALR